MIGFQPIVPQTGYVGWRFLERTVEMQREAFEKSPELARDLEYFKENISKATTAEDLVNDRRLLKVALGAFGLEDDLNKRAYVLKALVEGTDADDSFANRMIDKRYQEFSKAFGYGNQTGARVASSDFSQSIIAPFKLQKFEVAVGETDDSMRLAMVFVREIGEIANSDGANESAWFKVMGNPPLRQVFETAFGLPKSFGLLDVDKQRDIFQDKSRTLFGDSSLAVFKESENVDKMLRTFFARQQISENSGIGAPGATALTLLRNSAAGMASFFQSRL
ncbi:MAG: flagellar protein [Rhodobacteraceae bacterium]|nr:MAG: flagellar protein [Paracoccaceae bacterium]